MKVQFARKSWKTIVAAGLVMGLATLWSSASMAQTTVKIGTVDVRKVYESWTEKKNMEKDFEPVKKELEDKQMAIKEAETRLEKQATALSDAQKKAEQKKIDNLKKEFKKTYDEVVGKIDMKSEELSKRLDDLLTSAFDDLSKKEGFTLILDDRFVRFAVSGTDVTDKVVEAINKASAKAPEKKESDK